MQVKINNIDYTSQIERRGFRFEENITSKVNTLNMQYKLLGSKSYVPKVGDTVESYDGTTKVFAGQIIQVVARVEADVPVYDIQCKDWVNLLDRRLVADSYQAQDLAQTVKDILADYASDITEGDIETTGIVIDDLVFNYARVSDAIRTIAEYAGYDWWVTTDKKLNFKVRGSNSAPFDADAENITSLMLTKNDKQLRNVIYVMGGDYVANSTTDTLSQGDGTRLRFTMPYVYDSAPVIKVDGTTKTVGVEGLHTTGYDCYWNRNEKIVYFPTAPADGAVIEVTGDPLLPLLVKMKSTNQDKGAYEYKVVDKSLKTKDAVRRRAKAELDAYADTIAEATFTTTRSGLRAGQRIYVYNTELGISGEKYIIQQVVATPNTKDNFTYMVKLANVKAFEIIEFMRMLLEIGDRAIGGLGDSTAILDTIMTFAEQVKLNEVLTLNASRHTLAEGTTLTEDIKMRLNYQNTWVYGEYAPTSIDDPKRVPMWDKGALWG